MVSDPSFHAWWCGLGDLRVTAEHVMPHFVLCGILRIPGPHDWVVTNIQHTSGIRFGGVWCFSLVHERIDLNSARMVRFPDATPHWPYGFALEPVFQSAGT